MLSVSYQSKALQINPLIIVFLRPLQVLFYWREIHWFYKSEPKGFHIFYFQNTIGYYDVYH